ncbi:MAG: M28 family metallopeptidase, partial [Microvirga sp.]
SRETLFLRAGAHPMRDLELYRPRCGWRHRVEEREAVAADRMLDLPINESLAKLGRAVCEQRLRADVEHLSGYPTRHTLSSHLRDAAQWLEQQFRNAGYTEVERQSITRRIPQRNRAMTFFNVICRKPGAGADRRVVCAHFDSRTKAPLDSKSEAPGANDNATGVAVLLECARLLSQIRLPDTIEFAAVSGEEQGLWGSTRYASDLSHQGAHLRFMLNIDEVGFPNAHREVIVEHDTGNHLRRNNRASRELAKDVVAVATHHLGIPAKHAGIVDSDYMPFEARGYVTLGLYESGNYDEFRHTARDTIDGVNFAYVADVTRVALTALLWQGPGERPAAKRGAPQAAG